MNRTEKLRSKLRDVFTHAQLFYNLMNLHTDDPDYTALAYEFEAGLQVLDSLIGESGAIEHAGVISGLKHSLIRFRDDVKDSYPLQALLVMSILEELKTPDHRVRGSEVFG
jgi:hypothetical protein